MEKFRDWFHDECLSMSIDLALLKESKAKKNIELYNNTVRLLELTWDHQQAKIDKLEAQNKELVEALEKSVEYLKQGRARFAPHTTNSFVDEFIEKWEAKIKSEGILP